MADKKDKGDALSAKVNITRLAPSEIDELSRKVRSGLRPMPVMLRTEPSTEAKVKKVAQSLDEPFRDGWSN